MDPSARGAKVVPTALIGRVEANAGLTETSNRRLAISPLPRPPDGDTIAGAIRGGDWVHHHRWRTAVTKLQTICPESRRGKYAKEALLNGASLRSLFPG